MLMKSCLCPCLALLCFLPTVGMAASADPFLTVPPAKPEAGAAAVPAADLGTLSTRAYPLPGHVIALLRQQAPTESKQEIQAMFTAQGIDFSAPGAEVTFQFSSGTLIVKNTLEQLHAVELLICQEADPLPKNIRLTYEAYSLPKAEAAALLQSQHGSDAIYAAVKKAPQATLEKLLVIVTKSGQRAKVESIDEYPYPTDFDPPQVPQSLHLGPTGTVPAPPAVPPTPPPVPAKATAEGAPPVQHNAGLGLMTNLTGTTFTTRNTGDTLELDPVIGDDNVSVDVTIAPTFVALRSLTSLGQNLDQPNFQSQQLNTSMTCDDGHARFLGTQSKPVLSGMSGGNADDLVWLSFITPQIIPIPTAAAETPHLHNQCQLRWEAFSLTLAAAAELLPATKEDATLHSQLCKMVAANGARLESCVSISTKSGQRAKVEQNDEFTYGTDFDPPQVPQTLTISSEPLLAKLLNEGGLAPLRLGTLGAGNLGMGIITKTSTTSYTTRNLGFTLEVDPVIGVDGTTVDFTTAPECVRFIHDLNYADCHQPIFETQKLNASVASTVGFPVLLGTFSRPYKTGAPNGNQENRIWLAFITPDQP